MCCFSKAHFVCASSIDYVFHVQTQVDVYVCRLTPSNPPVRTNQPGSVDLFQDPVRPVPADSGQGRHRGTSGRPAGPGEHSDRKGHHGVKYCRLHEPHRAALGPGKPVHPSHDQSTSGPRDPSKPTSRSERFGHSHYRCVLARLVQRSYCSAFSFHTSYRARASAGTLYVLLVDNVKQTDFQFSPPLSQRPPSPTLPLYPDKKSKVISNYTKKLAATDPEANPIRGPPQPPSWELPEGSDFPDVSDDESEGEEGNNYNSYSNINGDRPLSLSETRKEMGERMEKKVQNVIDGDTYVRRGRGRRHRQTAGVVSLSAGGAEADFATRHGERR